MSDVLYRACPGCTRPVQVLPPRNPKPGRVAVGWRRRAHSVAGTRDLGARYDPGPRCRYPTDLTTDEIAQLAQPLEEPCT